MKINKIDHIGIAVKNIDESIKLYTEVLGLKLVGFETVTEQKVKTAILQIGESKIELLEATDPTSTIAGFIEKRGEGMHHIAVNVDNVEKAIADAKARGVPMIDEKPRKGVENSKIAFMHPKGTKVLMELTESEN
jgi:methylmalonyl-CoA/ethylmalonyl-CoA epimerase